MSDSNPATSEHLLPKDRAAARGMVNVQVDGTWIEVPKGTRMIEACRAAGTIVPHYCYHPKLSSPGSCRMCLVQSGMPARAAPGHEPPRDADGYQPIEWAPRPVIACANPVAENMGIRTNGPVVEECQQAVMEFLLINHPLDCPICDQAGECRLQELAVSYGRGTSRFLDLKVKKPKNVDIGPRVRLDDERCILCGRCVRFMAEVAGDPVLGFAGRGSHTILTVHPGRLLDSNYSLNTVDLCPVGALTATDFRFQMRVWFLKETPSIDVNCGTGCNITIWSRGNRVYRITPRPNDAVNSWWMPDSHRLAFHHLEDPRRLTQPLARGGPGTPAAPVPWPAAINAAATGLARFPGERTAVIASGRMTNEELFLARLLAAVLGTTRLALVPRRGEPDGLLVAADRNPNTTGAALVWQTADPSAGLAAIRADVRAGTLNALVCLGEELTAEAGFTAADLARLDFLAVTALLAGPTPGAADVVLPTAGFAEKHGSMVNVTGRLQRLNRAIDPPADARDDWEVLRDLAEAVRQARPPLAPAPPPPHHLDDVFRQLAATVPAFANLSLARIGDLGTQVTTTTTTIPLLAKERARKAAGEIAG